MSTDATAAKIAALQASALTRVDQQLCKLFRHIASELETPAERFNTASARRQELLDDRAFCTDLSAARRECQAAGIPYTVYGQEIDTAASVYSELARFLSVPCPPPIDVQRVSETEEAYLVPVQETDAYMDAHRRLAEVQRRMHLTINKLVEFRDASLGATLPQAFLPDPGSVLLKLAQELERVIQRLRYEPAILFEKYWDFNEGLHGAELNRLATPLQRGCIFEYEEHEDRRLLRVRHPDGGKLSITWTVWSRGWDHFTAIATDKAHAMQGLAKFTDTLDYLRAWLSVAEAKPQSRPAVVPDPPDPPLPDGPFLKGCFRYLGREESGIGEKQWLLLSALWGEKGPLEKATVDDAHRAVYGRQRVNRDKLRTLWNALNETLGRLKIGYEVAPTLKGGEEIRLQPTATPTTAEGQRS